VTGGAVCIIYGTAAAAATHEKLPGAAARSGCSIAKLVRDAIRKVVLKPQAPGPVAIWDGKPRRSSIEHDSVHDEP